MYRCLELAAQGKELGLLNYVFIYCKFITWGRENFNVRVTYVESDEWFKYLRTSDDNKLYNKWKWRIKQVEREYVIKCKNFTEYRYASDLLCYELCGLGVSPKIELYDDYIKFQTEESYEIFQIKKEIKQRLQYIQDECDLAERKLSEIIYGRFLKRELKDKKTIEEILNNPQVMQAIAEINIYRKKIRQYDTL
jgi:hypothetical protein